MKELILSSLKKLLDEIESGELVDINEHINYCWEELSRREKDTSISPEVIVRNKRVLEELTVIFRKHKEKPISGEVLHKIKSKIFGEQSKKEVIDPDYLHLKEDISDISDLLTEIEQKMKKGDKAYKE